MFSDHAPNRNPAEISFAAVDRRLSSKQRKEVLSLAEHYDADSYHVTPELGKHFPSVLVVDTTGYSIATVDGLGNVYPEFFQYQ